MGSPDHLDLEAALLVAVQSCHDALYSFRKPDEAERAASAHTAVAAFADTAVAAFPRSGSKEDWGKALHCVQSRKAVFRQDVVPPVPLREVYEQVQRQTRA